LHITAFEISLSLSYTNQIQVTQFVLKMGEKIKITDPLLNQQIEEKRHHYPNLHPPGQVLSWK